MNARILLGVALALAACNDTGVKETGTAPATQIAVTAPVAVAFDLPLLVGMTIDELRQTLGAPLDRQPEPTEVQMDVEFKEWSNSFTNDGQSLLVTYNPVTRNVVDFFLEGDDKTTLMKRANVTEGHDYSFVAVRSLRDGSKIRGIKVIPGK